MASRYLRVLTPQTTDGNSPMLDSDDKIVYKESHLDVRALKIMQEKNVHLPQHLRHKLEIVTDEPPVEEAPAPRRSSKGQTPAAPAEPTDAQLLEMLMKRGLIPPAPAASDTNENEDDDEEDAENEDQNFDDDSNQQNPGGAYGAAAPLKFPDNLNVKTPRGRGANNASKSN